MSKVELCIPDANSPVLVERLEHSLGFEFGSREIPKHIKRKRLTCPKCKRRLMSSVSIDEDGTDVYHRLPPHKPKGWWKRGVKK